MQVLTNGEWLFSKPFEEQVAWMNEEHKDGTLDGDTAALNAKIAELKEQVYELRAALDSICISLALHKTSKPITTNTSKPEAIAKLVIAAVNNMANEREHYRSKFSRALGYADDIHALMDEGMA